MKYNTMNNNEIILSLCARIKETRISGNAANLLI